MKHTTRFALIGAFLGASVIANGAVDHANVPQMPGVQTYLSNAADAHMASMGVVVGAESSAPASSVSPAQPAAVPYFPAQYVLNAAPGTSEPISTF